MSLATLAWQTACGMETVAQAQFECGGPTNPCYVRLASNDTLFLEDSFRNTRALRVSP